MSMALQRQIVVLLLLVSLFRSSYSYQFMVGWVPNPSENYNTWSQRMRFQINDSVLFKYKQGADSVMEVNKDDYDKCNTGSPIKKMEDGNSIFTFDRSGPFYFISGNIDNCNKGQKLKIVVISVRNQGKPPSITPPSPKTPAPAASSPSNGSSTPSTPSPMGAPPSPSAGSTTPPPKNSAPSASSAAAPPKGSSTPGTPSPNGAPVSTPTGETPTSSPTPAGSNLSPTSPVTGGSPIPVTNAPSTNNPAFAPAGGPSGSPGSIASGPGGNTPADINSPAGSPSNPNSLAVRAFTPSVVLVSAVSLVLTVALGEFIISH